MSSLDLSSCTKWSAVGPIGTALWLLICVLATGQAAQHPNCSDGNRDAKWSLLQTSWFRGAWHSPSKLTWPGTDLQKNDHGFLLTWSHRGRSLNVSEPAAVRAVGPMTLLHMLQQGKEDAQGSLLKAVSRARIRGHLRLHVLGVNYELEPFMAWDRLLIGPPEEAHLHLLKAFDLPIAPFQGLNVTVLFNGMEDQEVSKKGREVVRKRREHHFAAKRSHGFRQVLRAGAYHKVVDEIPDVAMVLNAGLAHYPDQWYPTICHLSRHGVPLIVTGSGDHLQRVYQYDTRLAPKLEGHSLHLPDMKTSQKWSEGYSRPWFPGFEEAGSSESSSLVEEYSGSEGAIAWARQWSASDVQLWRKRSDGHRSICTDADGNSYLAKLAGFSVALSEPNPFAFCDDHEPLVCYANGAVSLLEPAAKGKHDRCDKAPSDLFSNTLHAFLKCFPPAQRKCLQRALDDNLLKLSSTLIDDHFVKAKSACARS